jgi:PAS domain S-box-containing protein
MPDVRPVLLVVGSAADEALVAGALAADDYAVDLLGARDVDGIVAACERRFTAVVVAEGAGVDLGTAIATWRKRSLTPPVVVLAKAWSEAGMKAAFAAGAVDFVGADRLATLAPVLRREIRRSASAAVTSPRTDDAHRAALLQAIVDTLPLLLFAKDADEFRMVIVNEAVAQSAGAPKEAFLGMTDHDYFPPEQAAEFGRIDREVMATRQMKTFEEVARLAGVDRVVATRKYAIEVDGKPYLVGITEDVTGRHAADEALRKSKAELEHANQRLESNLIELKKSRAVSARVLASYQQRALQMEIIRQQNEDLDRLAQDLSKSKRIEEERSREIEQAARLKSEFLANFSHEIRTPLNGIIGYCDLLMREEGSRLTPHGRRDLQVVKANAKTLLGLINDILDLSKIEAGHVEIVREKVDAVAVVDECVATIRDFLKGKQVDVLATVAPDVATLETDALKLRQILLNLLTNAAKFTDNGEILVDARREGDQVVFTVEDTGAGIPDDQVAYIFEKFRQVDGSATRKVGGTGLGLAIVRELCKVLGGTVDVKSTVGRGSVFTVRLPILDERGDVHAVRRPTPSADVPAARPSGATVLVVDDDPVVQQLLKVELEREGMRVLIAADGIEAMTMARHYRPSAIVLDIHLPKLDGWTVLADLKADPALASIPVVIVSIEEQRARGISLGAVEYLVKPIDPEKLVATIARTVTPGSGEILVVDDDPTARELVSRQLRRAGFSTAEAANGDDALLRSRVTRPALIVLDLMMPGTSGFEVLRQLRAEAIPIPVVVLTGKTLSETEVQQLRDGLTSVVQKDGAGLDGVVAEAKRVLVEQRKVAKARLPRVLYVEDSAQNRDVVRRYLFGVYEVIEAEDGEHGLDRAQRDLPDLILMDLSLPRLDGWEATRRLKASTLAHIPVVALTAHASRDDQGRAKAAGCDGYLTKPVERDVLISTIRKHLAGPVPASPG